MKNTPIAVTSRSFSRHPVLRAQLLERYSNVRFNDEGIALSGDALIKFCAGRRKIISALETIDDTFLTALPELEVIAKYGVGTDMLDKSALIAHGIKLGWTGGVNKRSVSELALSFMLSLLHLVPQTNLDLRNGVWKNRKGRCLSDKNVGIIGCGNVGKDLAQILESFNCKIRVNDIRNYTDFYEKHDIEAVALDELLRKSDIVTLHVPLDSSTKNILSAERLQLLKEGAVLINAARGGLVDESTLKKLLLSGKIAAAGFDVFSLEPPEDIELINLPNFLCTPHIGGSSEEAILAMGRAAIAGLDNNRVPTSEYPPAG